MSVFNKNKYVFFITDVVLWTSIIDENKYVILSSDVVKKTLFIDENTCAFFINN